MGHKKHTPTTEKQDIVKLLSDENGQSAEPCFSKDKCFQMAERCTIGSGVKITLFQHPLLSSIGV